jgi:hypothetical protein
MLQLSVHLVSHVVLRAHDAWHPAAQRFSHTVRSEQSGRHPGASPHVSRHVSMGLRWPTASQVQGNPGLQAAAAASPAAAAPGAAEELTTRGTSSGATSPSPAPATNERARRSAAPTPTQKKSAAAPATMPSRGGRGAPAGPCPVRAATGACPA